MVDEVVEGLRQHRAVQHEAVRGPRLEPFLHDVGHTFGSAHEWRLGRGSPVGHLAQRQLLVPGHLLQPVRRTLPTVAGEIAQFGELLIQLELGKVDIVEVPPEIVQ